MNSGPGHGQTSSGNTTLVCKSSRALTRNQDAQTGNSTHCTVCRFAHLCSLSTRPKGECAAADVAASATDTLSLLSSSSLRAFASNCRFWTISPNLPKDLLGGLAQFADRLLEGGGQWPQAKLEKTMTNLCPANLYTSLLNFRGALTHRNLRQLRGTNNLTWSGTLQVVHRKCFANLTAQSDDSFSISSISRRLRSANLTTTQPTPQRRNEELTYLSKLAWSWAKRLIAWRCEQT
jgi:hypothetical protein